MQQQSAAGKGAAKKNKKNAKAKLDSASSSSSSGPNPLFGRRIVVGITLGEPYVRFSTRAKVAQTGNSRWGEGTKKIYCSLFLNDMFCRFEGFMVNLTELIAQRLNFTYEFKLYPSVREREFLKNRPFLFQ